MEIILIILALAAGKRHGEKDADLYRLIGQFLQDGSIDCLLDSEWFQEQTIGTISGKEFAAAYKTVKAFTENVHGLPTSLLSDGSAFTQTFQHALPVLSEIFLRHAQKSEEHETPSISNQQEDFENLTNPFSPIAKIADSQILVCLNQYYS